MEKFIISLADIPIEISTVHPNIRSFFVPYIVKQEDPLICVHVSKEEIEKEKELTLIRDISLHKNVLYSEAYFETCAILRLIAENLPSFNTLLFHGSAVVYKNKTYIFTAPSRTGKTTHAKKWPKILPEAYILNGDKPFLKIHDDNSVSVCGTPWRGKENYGCNEIRPLEAICYIQRSESNSIRTLSKNEALPLLAKQIHWSEHNRIETVQLLTKLIDNVDLYLLKCNKEDESAIISSHAMIKNL